MRRAAINPTSPATAAAVPVPAPADEQPADDANTAPAPDAGGCDERSQTVIDNNEVPGASDTVDTVSSLTIRRMSIETRQSCRQPMSSSRRSSCMSDTDDSPQPPALSARSSAVPSARSRIATAAPSAHINTADIPDPPAAPASVQAASTIRRSSMDLQHGRMRLMPSVSLYARARERVVAELEDDEPVADRRRVSAANFLSQFCLVTPQQLAFYR